MLSDLDALNTRRVRGIVLRMVYGVIRERRELSYDGHKSPVVLVILSVRYPCFPVWKHLLALDPRNDFRGHIEPLADLAVGQALFQQGADSAVADGFLVMRHNGADGIGEYSFP
jgi:hypothetical protein